MLAPKALTFLLPVTSVYNLRKCNFLFTSKAKSQKSFGLSASGHIVAVSSVASYSRGSDRLNMTSICSRLFTGAASHGAGHLGALGANLPHSPLSSAVLSGQWAVGRDDGVCVCVCV